jgi:predicted DNA-binding transcriptional regulator AlpA
MSDLLHDPSHEPCTLNSDPQERSPAALVLDDFLRREQLAKLFGLSPRTIDRWEALRIGPPRVCIGRTILYNVQAVREWLLSNQTEPPVSSRCKGLTRPRGRPSG